MIKSALAKIAAAKIATTAAVAAAAATGGLSLAAATGHLPGPLQHAAHSAFSAPDSHHADSTLTPQATGSDTPTDTGSSTGSATDTATDSSSASESASATPNPNLVGLCHAYEAGVGDNPGKALDNPAFTVLITTAGGKDSVTSFCTTLLASAHPSESNEPSDGTGSPSEHGKPSDVPPTHPDGRPSSVPGGDASTHSNGGGGSDGGAQGGEPTAVPTPTRS